MSKFQPVEYPYNRAGSCHFHKLCDWQTTLQFAYNITWEVQRKEVLRSKRNKNELKFQKGSLVLYTVLHVQLYEVKYKLRILKHDISSLRK